MLHPAITTAVCLPSPEFGDPPPPGPLDSQGPGTEPFGGLHDGVSQFYGGGSDWQRRFNDVFGKPDHRLYDTQGPQGNPGTQVQAAAAKPSPPLDVQALEELNQAAQGFFKRNTFPAKGHDELRQDLIGAQA